MNRSGTLRTAACLTALALIASGCSGQDRDDGRLSVVTTTSVYADIVRQVAGDDVRVTPIIDATSQDPHSYEATAQDQLRVRRADVVVLNGGGFDPFMAEAADGGQARVIDAVAVSGLPGAEEAAAQGGADHDDHDHAGHEHQDHDHGEFNEHVWYDPSAMRALTRAVARELGEADPAGKDGYDQRAEAYGQRLGELAERLRELPGKGRSYVATEPVPDRMLETAGLENRTPEEYAQAVEAETDAPAAALHAVRQRISGRDVDLLAYNPQTESAQTEDLRADAEDAGVPVVEFTETLPEGEDYLQWMGENAQRLSSALT